MLEPIALLSFAAVLFVVSLTPGPAAAFCIAIGFEEHGRAAMWAPVGVTLGKLTHLAIGAVGATWTNALPTPLRLGVLFGAIAYMIWEGFRHWTQRAALAQVAADHSRRHALHIVIDGFLVSVANPESLASSLAILSLFATADMSGSGWAVLLTVGSLVVAAAYGLYELIAVSLSRHLSANALNRLVGATYVAAAVGLSIVIAI